MLPRLCVFLFCVGLASVASVEIAGAADQLQVDWTKTSMRPLPHASDRPLASVGTKYFVDTLNGKDEASGTFEQPWRTLARGTKNLKPGDTLVLRGGTYYETLGIDLAGTKEAPITLRAHPGELVVLDGGYREFFENPTEAWEPVKDGAPGEYRSKKAYPDLGLKTRPRRDVYAMGNFGESMVPLHGYNSVLDLRSDNMLANLEEKFTAASGMYVGPGLWYDGRAVGKSTYGTQRIHIRLAPTTLDYLGAERNYRGEDDPRKLKLVISGPKPVVQLDGAKHVHLQDLVLRGSRGETLSILGGEGIELDGLSVYGGAPAIRFMSTRSLRLVNSAFRGVSAPWSSRYAEKYRGVSTYLLEAIADSDEVAEDKEASDSTDVAISFCEFSDCHDGLMIHAIKSMKFHNNWVDNFNDDGIEPGPKKRERYVHIYNNRISGTFLTLSLHGDRKPGPPIESAPGSGVYIFRNLFDLRAPSHYAPPRAKQKQAEYRPMARLGSDHGSPTWPVYYMYHNTILHTEVANRNMYALDLAAHMEGTKRWIYNNIFFSTGMMPAANFDKPTVDLMLDGNLSWCVTADSKMSQDFFAKHRASALFKQTQQLHPPGWAAHDVFADPKFDDITTDWRKGGKLTVQKGSPAIDAGVSVPTGWPDSPDGQGDRAKPDIGAIPHGTEACAVGVRGRHTLFGEPNNLQKQ